MLGPFTFTFTLESEEFEKFEKVGCWVCTYQTLITTRAPDGANKSNPKNFNPSLVCDLYYDSYFVYFYDTINKS